MDQQCLYNIIAAVLCFLKLHCQGVTALYPALEGGAPPLSALKLSRFELKQAGIQKYLTSLMAERQGPPVQLSFWYFEKLPQTTSSTSRL